MIQRLPTRAELKAAKILWKFHKMHHKMPDRDYPIHAIIHAGNNTQAQTVERAMHLFMYYGAKVPVVFSGAKGHLTEGVESDFETEADEAMFEASYWLSNNAPLVSGWGWEEIQGQMMNEGLFIPEYEATNAGLNVSLSKQALEAKNIRARRIIIVQKPFMERRMLGHAEAAWPELDEIFVTSPKVKFHDYPTSEFDLRAVICTMVTDFMKVFEYRPRGKGFMSNQDIPDEVWKAYGKLLAAGYTDDIKHML